VTRVHLVTPDHPERLVFVVSLEHLEIPEQRDRQVLLDLGEVQDSPDILEDREILATLETKEVLGMSEQLVRRATPVR